MEFRLAASGEVEPLTFQVPRSIEITSLRRRTGNSRTTGHDSGRDEKHESAAGISDLRWIAGSNRWIAGNTPQAQGLGASLNLFGGQLLFIFGQGVGSLCRIGSWSRRVSPSKGLGIGTIK